MIPSHVRSPLKMIGGKAAAAERIVQAFPDPAQYTTFVEVCGGAAHVLMAKPTYGHIEIYNDLSNNLVTFWEQIQCHADIMQQRLDTMLYSRKIYYTYYRSLFDGTALDPLERAIRYFYVLRSTGTGWVRRSPVGWNHRGQSVQAFHSAVDLFQAVQERFRLVAVDNRDVLATIKRYDSPKTLLYCDPPYVGAEHYYDASKDGFPHEELASVLNTAKSHVALSYYPYPELDTWYPSERWRQLRWQQHKPSALRLGEDGVSNDVATELLLLNYPEDEGLFSRDVQ
jgi:DNA adenine methylase